MISYDSYFHYIHIRCWNNIKQLFAYYLKCSRNLQFIPKEKHRFKRSPYILNLQKELELVKANLRRCIRTNWLVIVYVCVPQTRYTSKHIVSQIIERDALRTRSRIVVSPPRACRVPAAVLHTSRLSFVCCFRKSLGIQWNVLLTDFVKSHFNLSTLIIFRNRIYKGFAFKKIYSVAILKYILKIYSNL